MNEVSTNCLFQIKCSKQKTKCEASEEKEKKSKKETESKLQEQATSDQMHQQKVLKKVESNGGEDEKGCQQWKSK